MLRSALSPFGGKKPRPLWFWAGSLSFPIALAGNRFRKAGACAGPAFFSLQVLLSAGQAAEAPHIYTVRTSELKTFCDDVEVQYKKLLGYCKTRWLALLPAIERVLQMYLPLKSYFVSQDKCPVVLHNFFKDGSSEFWLKFLHQQASTFHDTVKMLEVDTINFSEVSEIICGLKEKYKNRLQN